MKNNLFANKKILITGHLGFLGSNLSKELLKRKSRLVGIDKKKLNNKTVLTSSEIKKIKNIKADICNFTLINKVIKENKIELVFHLAAEAIVGKCFKNPLNAFSTNIKGTWYILEACRENPCVKEIIIASSDKAYGNNNKLPYKENYPLQGNHPYDVSKSCADLIANTYYNSYQLPVCITRCGNIYGPGDVNFSRVVPDTIRSIIKNKKLFIRSNGKYTRDYIYIDDIVSGYLALAEKMRKNKLYGQAFNFSNHNPISVLELVKLIYKSAGEKPNYQILDKAFMEIKDQYLSAQKAQKLLDWKPAYSLKKGLNKTINWYKNYFLAIS